MDQFPPGYYREAARRAGVPEMWEEDAMQDIALRVWRSGRTTRPEIIGVVRHAAIDAVRRYGMYTRARVARSAFSLEEVILQRKEPIDVPPNETRVDFLMAFRSLPPVQRRDYLKWLRGEARDNRTQKAASDARARLRMLMGVARDAAAGV